MKFTNMGWKICSGIWPTKVKHIFRNLTYEYGCKTFVGFWPTNMGETYVQEDFVKNIWPSSAKSICYFSVCHWVFSQGSIHNNNKGARPRCGAVDFCARFLWALCSFFLEPLTLTTVLDMCLLLKFLQEVSFPPSEFCVGQRDVDFGRLGVQEDTQQFL